VKRERARPFVRRLISERMLLNAVACVPGGASVMSARSGPIERPSISVRSNARAGRVGKIVSRSVVELIFS